MHPDKTRVIVTHTDGDGKSLFTEQVVETIVEADTNGEPVYRVSQLWGTPPGIGTVGPDQNPEQVLNPWYPEPGGVRFRFFTFEPLGAGAVHAEAGIQQVAHDDGSGFVEAFDPERPGMHISDSVDFVHVLSGPTLHTLRLSAPGCSGIRSSSAGAAICPPCDTSRSMVTHDRREFQRLRLA